MDLSLSCRLSSDSGSLEVSTPEGQESESLLAGAGAGRGRRVVVMVVFSVAVVITWVGVVEEEMDDVMTVEVTEEDEGVWGEIGEEETEVVTASAVEVGVV